MVPLVYYALGGEKYYYRQLQKSLTSLLKNYDGQVLVIADRNVKIPCDRVRVAAVPMRLPFDTYGSRLWIDDVLRSFPTRTYALDLLRLLYIDTDVIVTGPVSRLYSECPRHDSVYFALENPCHRIGGEWNGKYTMSGDEEKAALKEDRRAWNSGTFLADYKNSILFFRKWADVYFGAVKKYDIPHEHIPGLGDQSALNTLVYRGVVEPIPFPKWLVQFGWEAKREALPVLVHFSGADRDLTDRFAPPERDLIPIEGLG